MQAKIEYPFENVFQWKWFKNYEKYRPLDKNILVYKMSSKIFVRRKKLDLSRKSLIYRDNEVSA